MAQVPNPMEQLAQRAPVSKQTMHMAGLLVDVYGLAELAPSSTRVSCLWLHHPRTRSREDMADIAGACVRAWNRDRQMHQQRGLIALAFDQRNHGSRLVRRDANAAWRAGNETHAQDMFGVIAGTVADQMGLLDAVGGYLFVGDDTGREIDQHLVLGVSLGGHSAWQLMFKDPRVTAAVVVVGCPDFMYLLSDRARLSKLSTYRDTDRGASFLGSTEFPAALVAACEKLDPKAVFFSTGPVGQADTHEEEARRRKLLSILTGKKFLICSGAEDKLVPYRCSKPFLDWLKQALQAGVVAPGVYVEDDLYEGAGHVFTAAMVRDAVKFVVDVLGGSIDERLAKGSVVISSTVPEDKAASKI